MAGGEEIVDATAHRFASEILVELMCRDGDGDLVVYSYAFSCNGENTVQPKETVPTHHRERVTTALTENGYDLHAGSHA